VLLDATLTYRITDPAAYVVARDHVGPALDRLFRTSAIDVAGRQSLDDFLVAQPDRSAGQAVQTVAAIRQKVRDDLLALLNARLAALGNTGAPLGIMVDRIDLTAWLPPQAKLAFDALLVAEQVANQGLALAHTQALRTRQEADRESRRVLDSAQAAAAERISVATADVSPVLALETEAAQPARAGLLMDAYRSRVAAWASGDLLTTALLPIVMTAGHVLEERSLLGSQEAIRALGRLTATSARRIRADGTTEAVDTSALQPGDLVELRAGDRVPADGFVLRGQASLDVAALTGESEPVDVGPGSQAAAGALNTDGWLEMSVERVGAATTLGRIIALMQEAETAKPPLTRLLDEHAGQYMGLVLLIAAIAWFWTGNGSVMLAVLVASCPCALVLAAPATAVAPIAVAARHSILIKGAAFLESLAEVSCVVFDKTGTITTGALALVATQPVGGGDDAVLRRVAANLGAASNHPVSRAAGSLAPHTLVLNDLHEAGGQGMTATLAAADLVLMGSDLRRLGTAIRLSRLCRRTIHVNVAIGLGWTVVLITAAAAGSLGAEGAIVAALLHNFSTLLGLGYAGRLLLFDETRPAIPFTHPQGVPS
jgi:cation transport ATPase